MIKFITGAAGSGKSTEMIRQIDKLADSGAEICIIVPEQFSYEFDKNLYKSIGAQKFNKLFSLSFTGIARQLFQLFGDGKRKGEYADETVRMILVYQAISAVQKNPQARRFFNKQLNHTGFAEEILKLISEMKKSGVTPEELINKSAFLDKKLMDKTNDIALIYLEYEKLMLEYNFKDNWDDIKEAANIAALNRYFSGKSVFIDEFESFTGDQLDFIETIISNAEDVFITLRTDDVNAGEYTLFETVNSTYRKLTDLCRKAGKKFQNITCSGDYRFRNPDISYLSRNILRTSIQESKQVIPQPSNITIFEAKDYYSEAEYVCASIKRLLCSDKTMKYGDIAVIANNIEEYADVLEAAFERYDIPYFLSLEKPVMHTSIMIFFSTLLNIVSRKNFNSELIYRYMKCGMLDISLTEISMLENYCFKWGIDGEVWTENFRAPDENLELLEQIRFSVIAPLENLRNNLRKNTTAKQFCRQLYDHLVKCGAEKSVSETIGNLILENKDYSASEVKRLWSCLMDILDSVSGTLGDSEISVTELRKIFNSLIGRINYSVPPQTLDSVTAASARTARLNAPRAVFVMGANDGDFPNTVNVHGIFSETDKQKLSENGIEISRRLPELIASERLIVYKSLSAASEKVYITYSLSDLSGQMKYSAPVIDSIIKLFNDKSILITESQISSDYYAVTMKSAYYRYMQDRKLNNSSISSIEKLLMDDFDYRRKLTYVMSAAQQKRDYKVSIPTVELLKNFKPMRISPSSFELYNRCHFQYFCQECLKLMTREKVDLNVRYSGNIIHSCFYNIISKRNKAEFLKLSYEELKQEISDCADNYLHNSMGGEFAKTPRFELGFKKLSERLINVFMHTQQELMVSSFEPHSFEVNLRDENTHLRLPFGNGKYLSFGGIIDRADICMVNDEKYVRIIDYKSSRKNIDKYTLSNGINMQMLLYLFAITQENGIFSEYKPAGVLYSPVSISSIDADEVKNNTENLTLINSKLKTSGLILGEKDVLEAMEQNISGKYIPAKLNKQNEIDEKSSCLSPEAFSQLKDYTYRKLTEMAESVYSGDADANPLIFNETDNPCNYCEYINICGNSPVIRYRSAHDSDTAEAEEILSNKTKEKNEDGMD
ncbi:MAG: exodeoxyribonuclease V subunit gamma [Ruminococcus sp.]|nr:exodeoxyribonuclease V subunit gamma [Ruminococcus sp.]